MGGSRAFRVLLDENDTYCRYVLRSCVRTNPETISISIRNADKKLDKDKQQWAMPGKYFKLVVVESRVTDSRRSARLKQSPQKLIATTIV